mmetsp:Transcript_28651/g.63077  ORF Transcript_28651/g.63077 Transcript_28651/m.63077 type:complete len:203 (-) Transcript_28651:118-726(-)
MVRDQPSLSKEFRSLVTSDAFSSFCCSSTLGRLKRIFIPGLAFRGQLTCTLTPSASKGNGNPGSIPCGTTTSNTRAAGGRIFTTAPGLAPSGHVTTSCIPDMVTGNLVPGSTSSGTFTRYSHLPSASSLPGTFRTFLLSGGAPSALGSFFGTVSCRISPGFTCSGHFNLTNFSPANAVNISPGTASSGTSMRKISISGPYSF